MFGMISILRFKIAVMEDVFLSFANSLLLYGTCTNILLSRNEKFNEKENKAKTMEKFW